MFFKKKKIKEITINTKYKLGEEVRFIYENESYIGRIVFVRIVNDNALYDICVGGECPWTAININEADIHKYIPYIGKK
jgi:hypothetical protein